MSENNVLQLKRPDLLQSNRFCRRILCGSCGGIEHRLNASPSDVGGRHARSSERKPLQGSVGEQNHAQRDGLMGKCCRTCQEGWSKGEKSGNKVAAGNERLNAG